MAAFNSFGYPIQSGSQNASATWHISVAGFNWHMTAAPLMLIVCILLGWLLIRTLIVAVICYIADAALKSVPPQYRRQNPVLIWLLLIPVLPFVWNYFVFPPIAKSFRNYFDAAGEKDRSDCGWAISIAMCICCDATLFRPVALVALICFLALLILTLLKFWELRRKALNLSATPPAADAEPMSPPSTASPAAPDRPYSPAGDIPEKVIQLPTAAVAPGGPYSPAGNRAQGPRQPPYVVPALIFLAAGFLVNALPFLILAVGLQWLLANGCSQGVLYACATFVYLLSSVALLIGAILIAKAALAANTGRRLPGILVRLSALFFVGLGLISAAWAQFAVGSHPGVQGPGVIGYGTQMIFYCESVVDPIAIIVFFCALASIVRAPQLRRTRYSKGEFRLLAVAVALVSAIQLALFTSHWLPSQLGGALADIGINGSYAYEQSIGGIMTLLNLSAVIIALLALAADPD